MITNPQIITTNSISYAGEIELWLVQLLAKLHTKGHGRVFTGPSPY